MNTPPVRWREGGMLPVLRQHGSHPLRRRRRRQPALVAVVGGMVATGATAAAAAAAMSVAVAGTAAAEATVASPAVSTSVAPVMLATGGSSSASEMPPLPPPRARLAAAAMVATATKSVVGLWGGLTGGPAVYLPSALFSRLPLPSPLLPAARQSNRGSGDRVVLFFLRLLDIPSCSSEGALLQVQATFGTLLSRVASSVTLECSDPIGVSSSRPPGVSGLFRVVPRSRGAASAAATRERVVALLSTREGPEGVEAQLATQIIVLQPPWVVNPAVGGEIGRQGEDNVGVAAAGSGPSNASSGDMGGGADGGGSSAVSGSATSGDGIEVREGGLSPGAIAGVAIGAVVGSAVALAVAVIVWSRRHHHLDDSSLSSGVDGGGGDGLPPPTPPPRASRRKLFIASAGGGGGSDPRVGSKDHLTGGSVSGGISGSVAKSERTRRGVEGTSSGQLSLWAASGLGTAAAAARELGSASSLRRFGTGGAKTGPSSGSLRATNSGGPGSVSGDGYAVGGTGGAATRGGSGSLAERLRVHSVGGEAFATVSRESSYCGDHTSSSALSWAAPPQGRGSASSSSVRSSAPASMGPSTLGAGGAGGGLGTPAGGAGGGSIHLMRVESSGGEALAVASRESSFRGSELAAFSRSALRSAPASHDGSTNEASTSAGGRGRIPGAAGGPLAAAAAAVVAASATAAAAAATARLRASANVAGGGGVPFPSPPPSSGSATFPSSGRGGGGGGSGGRAHGGDVRDGDGSPASSGSHSGSGSGGDVAGVASGDSPIPTTPPVEDEALATDFGIVRGTSFFSAEARRSSATSSAQSMPPGPAAVAAAVARGDVLE